LTYILSATLAGGNETAAQAVKPTTQETFYQYRRGSVLLGALTVLLVFLAAFVYVNNIAVASLSALLVALWPQITFIFSYNNDDAGALFTGSLLLLGLTLVDRYGPRIKYAALLGLAGGFIILSKPTAWLWLPTVILFVLRWGVRFGPARLLKPTLIALLLSLLTGGWWLAFNAWHYGADDIFLTKITQQMAAAHSRLEANYIHGFHANGISVSDLLLDNHGDFYTKTFYSTVGDLDWLRLPLRPHLYSAFKLLGLFVFIICIWRGIRYIIAGSSSDDDTPTNQYDNGANWILVFTCIFQFAIYVYANMYNDVQLQGKYLLPAVAAFILLLASSLIYCGRRISRMMNRYGLYEVTLSHTALGGITLVILAASVIAYHRDAVVNYVIPFYETPGFDIPLRKIEFGRLTAANPIIADNARRNDIESIVTRGNDSVLSITGADPWLVLNSKLCDDARGNSIVIVDMTAQQKDVLSLFWNDGHGYNETQRSSRKYAAGRSRVYLWLGTQTCRELRLDPGTQPGEITIHSVSIMPLRIDAHKR
jgi:hypothetical protein